MKAHSLSKKIVSFLIVILSLDSAVAADSNDMASDLPTLPGVDFTRPQDTLPEVLEQIVNTRVQDQNNAPPWVRQASHMELLSFFVDANGQALAQPKTRELLEYATRLHNYYEGNRSSSLFRGFTLRQLGPYVRSLTLRAVKSVGLNHNSVEDLVVTQQLSFLARSPAFFKNAMGLITGSHLRAVSAMGLKLVLLAGSLYFGQRYFGLSTTIFGMATDGLKFAVLIPIVGVATGWFTNPMTQYLRKSLLPISAPMESFMNRVLSSIDNTSVASTSKTSPRHLDLLKDGSNFGGMSMDDQKENMRSVTKWWAAHAISFGLLFRDTLQSGRGLIIGHTNDELFPNIMIQAIEGKLVSYRNFEESLLNPYKIDRLRVGNRADLEQLEQAFDKFMKRTDEIMVTLAVDPTQQEPLMEEWDRMILDLRHMGFTDRDLKELHSIQEKKARAIDELATALAANEIRHFNMAEYRTIQGPAYDYIRALQVGFGLQPRLEKHQEQVALQQRRLGYQNSSIPLGVSAPNQCALILGAHKLPFQE